jgi:hypothetical protein
MPWVTCPTLQRCSILFGQFGCYTKEKVKRTEKSTLTLQKKCHLYFLWFLGSYQTSSPKIKYCTISTECSAHVTCYLKCSLSQVFRSRLELLRSAKVFISSNHRKTTSKECKKVMVTTKNFASTPEQYGYFLKDFARSLVAYSTQC